MEPESDAFLSAVLGRSDLSVKQVIAVAYEHLNELTLEHGDFTGDAVLRAIIALREFSSMSEKEARAVRAMLGAVSTNLGRSDLAIKLFSRLLDETDDDADHDELAFLNGRLGSAYTTKGNYEAALSHQKAACHYLESIDDPAWMALAMNNYGLNLLRLKRYDEARHVLESVRVRRTELLGEAHLDTIATRLNLATLAYYQTDLEAAAKLIENCIVNLESTRQTLSPEYVNCQSWLARIYFYRNDLRKSELHLKLALKTAEAQGIGQASRISQLKLLLHAVSAQSDPGATTQARSACRAIIDNMWGDA